ncbi:hypothetical protein ACI3L1_17905 [Deinococcus sp. SM5_A1]|uniref:hypothetical protein n=1 Tax=Deinococcus sp. SM5_A1 TaxID=3379094 RepID=UPI00385DE5D6
MTQPEQRAAMTYTRLSDVLAQFPEDKRYTIYMRLKRQIRSGELRGVPTPEWVTIPRKGGPLRVSELLIDSAVDAWIQDALAEFSAGKKRQSSYVVNAEDIVSGKVDFAEAAQRYRESLQPKKAKRKPRTVKTKVE